MTVLRVAAVQHDIVWHDRDANFARLAPMIDAAAAGGAGLVLLTETFSTGFSFDTPGIGEPEGGPSSKFLAEQAAHARACGSAGRAPRSRPDAPADDQRPSNVLRARRARRHRAPLPQDPPVLPRRRGAVRPRRHRVRHGRRRRACGSACSSATTCASPTSSGSSPHDTDVYLVLANWPAKRRLHWSTLLQARAIENQAYVVGVNRVGTGGGLDYSGDSRDHRSARRAPGDRCRRRDDPVRRHRHRSRRVAPATTSASSRTAADPVRSSFASRFLRTGPAEILDANEGYGSTTRSISETVIP